MELSIANRGIKDFLISKVKKGKKEIKCAEEIEDCVIKKSIVVHTTPLKFSSKENETKAQKRDGKEKHHPTSKERQKKVYPFPDSDIANMLEQLLKQQLIKLSECKRSKQGGKVDDPKYYKYHQIISHPVEKCFVLKELILKLAREKKIKLDINEVAQTNSVAVEIT